MKPYKSEQDFYARWGANENVVSLVNVAKTVRVENIGGRDNIVRKTVDVGGKIFSFSVRHIFDFGQVVNPEDGGLIDCGGKVNDWDDSKGGRYTKRIMSDEEFAALLSITIESARYEWERDTGV